MLYESGIHDPQDCDDKINHALLLVGYGESVEGVPYWLVKNTWGKVIIFFIIFQNWGEDGYFRLLRGENKCRVNSYASIAFLE